jgi:hypothetical protein
MKDEEGRKVSSGVQRTLPSPRRSDVVEIGAPKKQLDFK